MQGLCLLTPGQFDYHWQVYGMRFGFVGYLWKVKGWRAVLHAPSRMVACKRVEACVDVGGSPPEEIEAEQVTESYINNTHKGCTAFSNCGTRDAQK